MRVRNLGIWEAYWIVRGIMHFNMRGAVPVYAHFDTRRDAGSDDHDGDVGVSPRARSGGGASASLGGGDGRKHRDWIPAKKSCRASVSGCGDGHLPVRHTPNIFVGRLETSATVQRAGDRPCDRDAMGGAGDAAESTDFCVDVAQRAGRIPRVFVVLFHK
jgi:hypothetical protein